MSTITREWLHQTIAEYEANRDELPFGLDTNSAIELQAFKLALASLEAEKGADPVAFINGAWTLVYYRPPKELGLKIGDKLYAAPPAPASVPDEITFEKIAEITASQGYEYSINECICAASWWNACRAAMLQDADGNSPVIPDGWVACSERMPNVGDIVLTAMGESVNVGEMERSGANYRFFTSVISGRELPATHWMPLPAAPQQEAKNV